MTPAQAVEQTLSEMLQPGEPGSGYGITEDPGGWFSSPSDPVLKLKNGIIDTPPPSPAPVGEVFVPPTGQAPAPEPSNVIRAQPSVPGEPVVGEIRRGYRFDGGNWRDKNNWTKMAPPGASQ
jgi:hypothetical protein